MERKDEKLRQYFLGSLSEAESEEIDLKIIEDEDFSAQCSLAESDLVEDFIENSLSESEIRLFKSNFVVSPERSLLFREISELKRFASGHIPRDETVRELAVTADADGGSFLRKLFRPVVLVPAFAAILLIVFAGWQIFFVTPMSPLEKEYAGVNNQDLSNLEAVSGASVFNLTTVTLRDAGTGASRRSGDLTETVLFRLSLSGSETGAKNFEAKVVRGSVPVFSVRSNRSYQNQNGSEVRLLLPKSILTPGRYQIQLTSAGTRGASAYSFTIE